VRGGWLMRRGAVYDCPFLPSEALRFGTALLWRGVGVRNRNASADRAVRVRARVRAGQRTARLLYIYMYMLYPAKYVYEPANRIYTLYIYIINRSVYGRMYDSLSESARPVR
jgi:hypothetical protein